MLAWTIAGLGLSGMTWQWVSGSEGSLYIACCQKTGVTLSLVFQKNHTYIGEMQKEDKVVIGEEGVTHVSQKKVFGLLCVDSVAQ